MECPQCHKEVDRIITISRHGVLISGCSSCIPLVGDSTTIIDHKTGTMTVAHRKDIERRRVAPDGSVYRDYGRKSFIV
jgi:hypothetical protein